MQHQTVTPQKNTIELPEGFILLTMKYTTGEECPVRIKAESIISYVRNTDTIQPRTLVTLHGDTDGYYVKETSEQIDTILTKVFASLPTRARRFFPKRVPL